MVQFGDQLADDTLVSKLLTLLSMKAPKVSGPRLPPRFIHGYWEGGGEWKVGGPHSRLERPPSTTNG